MAYSRSRGTQRRAPLSISACGFYVICEFIACRRSGEREDLCGGAAASLTELRRAVISLETIPLRLPSRSNHNSPSRPDRCSDAGCVTDDPAIPDLLKSMSQMVWRRVQVSSTMTLARAFLAACIIAEALKVMATRRAAGKVVIAVDSNSH